MTSTKHDRYHLHARTKTTRSHSTNHRTKLPQITEQNRHKSPKIIIYKSRQGRNTELLPCLFLLLVSAKNAEGMKEYRQAVKCEARNPCKMISNNRTLKG